MSRFAEGTLRLFGLLAALGFAVVGSLLVFILLIGGLWAGFSDPRFVLQFLLLVLYIYGTAALGLWLVFRPSKLRGIVLALLVIPGVVSVLMSPGSERAELSEAARLFVANVSPEQAEQARETLLARGRLAGRQPQVEILIEALAVAEKDAERVRLVCVLGELSGQYEPLLEVLRNLEQATADDPERATLNEAARYALLGVNPYEGMAPGQGAAQRPPMPAACRNASPITAPLLGRVGVPSTGT